MLCRRRTFLPHLYRIPSAAAHRHPGLAVLRCLSTFPHCGPFAALRISTSSSISHCLYSSYFVPPLFCQVSPVLLHTPLNRIYQVPFAVVLNFFRGVGNAAKRSLTHRLELFLLRPRRQFIACCKAPSFLLCLRALPATGSSGCKGFSFFPPPRYSLANDVEHRGTLMCSVHRTFPLTTHFTLFLRVSCLYKSVEFFFFLFSVPADRIPH